MSKSAAWKRWSFTAKYVAVACLAGAATAVGWTCFTGNTFIQDRLARLTHTRTDTSEAETEVVLDFAEPVEFDAEPAAAETESAEELFAKISEQNEPAVQASPQPDEAAGFRPANSGRSRLRRRVPQQADFGDEPEQAELKPVPTLTPTPDVSVNTARNERPAKPARKARDRALQAALFESEATEGAQPPSESNHAHQRPRRKVVQTAAEEESVPPPAAPATPAANPAIDLSQVESLLKAGEDIPAHKLLSQWYWKHPEERMQFQSRLDELALLRFFSPRPLFGEPYEVQPGDQLRKIAVKYHLSWQYLAKLNNVDPRKIRAGQKLKVVEGPFSAVIDLSDFELTIHCRGFFVRRYRVGVGKDGTTPLGEFLVKEKLEDPTYYGPNGEVRANDDPLNPLGERWIDIGDSFGIHGTIEPESIGRKESRGCVRMLNSDVEEVYDLLTIGSPVRIQR